MISREKKFLDFASHVKFIWLGPSNERKAAGMPIQNLPRLMSMMTGKPSCLACEHEDYTIALSVAFYCCLLAVEDQSLTE